jgi:Na+/phosphate symporter
LLNVDYVPILKNMKLPEIVEFGLHMVISVMLAIGVNFYITKKDLHKETIHSFVIKVSLVIGFLLFPTTLLSERTPSITNIYAFLFWMMGHWFYGLVLGRVLAFKEGAKA